MGQAPDTIKRLADRFAEQRDTIRSPDYNETLIRIDFINPLMHELGWDIDNRQNYAEQYREVVHEDRVKVAGQTKAPDYSFRIGGQRKFFLEAKKPAVDIKANWEPAYQLRRYAWSAKLACSLLTDFEEFAIYDTRIAPKQFDKPAVGRREFITFDQYADKWEFLHGTFSKDAVLRGAFDRYCESKKGRGAQPFDEAFLSEIEEWRKSLASNLALRNASLDDAGINFATQRIIDRILFLRIAEDRGTETVGQLQALISGDEVYKRLIGLFNRADERYNSGLFHFSKEQDRDEAPDSLTPTLDVDDKTLKDILKALYYPQSPYEFTMVSADILGSVYERFLGKVITLTAGHRAKIEEKPEVRKAGGVYYTPTYIVDYIVKNTVGKLLGDMTSRDREGAVPSSARAASATTKPPLPHGRGSLRILDPACGSGSFLIGAYQFLLDWYLQHYLAQDPASLSTGKKPVLRPTPTGSYALTIAERKRILLDHIHGVDLDSQAVEVTKLNLLLKCLEGETSQTLGFEQRLFRERALPDLGKNILCGNSLIGTDIMSTDAWRAMTDDEKARINPFDYDRAFPHIFHTSRAREGALASTARTAFDTTKPPLPHGRGSSNHSSGGFDAVIGNPPYVRQEGLKASKEYFERSFRSFASTADLFVYFIEKGVKLLGNGGRYSVIVSSSVLRSAYGEPLRAWLREHYSIDALTDFGGLAVFADAKDTYVCIPEISRRKRADEVAIAKVAVLPESNAKTFEIAGAYNVPVEQFTTTAWAVEPVEHRALLNRLLKLGTPLGRFVEGKFFRGLLTGLNEAFVVDAATASEIGQHTAARALLHRFVGGEDIREYHVEDVDKWMIVIPDGWTQSIAADTKLDDDAAYRLFAKTVPPIAEHLKTFRAGLEKRQDQGQFWWELRPCDYYSFFEKPKLIFPDICKNPRFYYDDTGLYLTNTAYCLGTGDKRLLAFLGSKLFWFLIAGVSIPFGMRAGKYRYRLIYQYMEHIPVRLNESGAKPIEDRLIAMADAMLSLHKKLAAEQAKGSPLTPQRREQIEREIAATDRQIDQLVYQLYGLTDDEISIVESATA
jgi:hypothetical protein